MTLRIRIGLILCLAGSATGCELEFVDVELDDHSAFSAQVFAVSDDESIRIRAALRAGRDESGNSRKVLSDLEVDGHSLTPESVTQQDRVWDLSLAGALGTDGTLILTPPRIEGLATPRQMIVPIPARLGPRDKTLAAGQPIALAFAFSPVPPLSSWAVQLLDARQRTLYSARSQNIPSGPLLIQEDVLPSRDSGPYEVRLSIVGTVADEPDQGRYLVSVTSTGELRWMVRRE